MNMRMPLLRMNSKRLLWLHCMESPQLHLRVATNATDPSIKYAVASWILTGGKLFGGFVPAAMKLLEEASELAHRSAQFTFGKALVEGLYGVAKDVPRATDLLRRAFLAGHLDALVLLARILAAGTNKDREEALLLMRLAADQGHTWSRLSVNLARLNRAVASSENPERAFAFYPDGCVSTRKPNARMEDALPVVPLALSEIAERHAIGARGGSIADMFALATLRRKGGNGVECDASDALRLMSEAATRGSKRAQLEVARMLFEGEGCSKKR